VKLSNSWLPFKALKRSSTIYRYDDDSSLISELKNLPINTNITIMIPNVEKNLRSSAYIWVNMMISSPKYAVLWSIMIEIAQDWTTITDRINLKSSSPALGLTIVYM
jgi:hypothetical protein